MPVPATRTRSRVLLEALEPRILYSADLAAVVGAVGTADAGGTEAGLVQEQRLQASATALATLATTAAAEIAFVDLSVPDAGTLLGGLLAQRAQGRLIEVVTFASDEDGLARLGQTLAERQAEGARFDAVHVFSHGSAGALQLGSATLDADSLLRRAGEIAGWGGALSAQADLLLYGCDVADGADGLFLIEGLAALTGADVAASDDTTGSAALGGDWLLEQSTGAIESTVAIDAPVQQDWAGALGNEIPVNSTTGGNQNTAAETRGSQQAVTLDAAGNYTVVWTGPEGGGGANGVFFRRFAFDGTALTGEIQVNTTTSKDQGNARIVGDSAGNFAVVWTSQDQDGTTASVYFRRFAANGTALSGEIRANASDTGDQLNAVIGMNASNGDVVVAWEGDGPGGQSVFFRRFALDGTALDATDRAAGTLSGELNPAVAMDATGRFVLTWNQGSHLYFQRYDASGAAAGGITQADNNLSNSVGPTVAMNDQGQFVIAYREQDTIPGIWGRTYRADGTPEAFWFNADTGVSTSPSISMAPDGSAVVVYQKTGDGDGMGIYGRKISAAGAVQGTAFLVNQSTAKEQVAASVAVHDADRFVVVWSGDSAADKDGVNARTFEPANTAPLITTNGGTSTAAVSVAENATAVTTVGASDADWPIQTVRYAIVGGADQARFAIDSSSGALRFVAAPDFERPADAGGDNVYEVTVQASDLLLSSNTQTLTVTVTDVADQVVAVADTAGTPYASAVTVDVLANDLLGVGGSALTLLEVSQPAHGKATVVGGQVVYTPDAGFVGTETLQYRVIDGSEGLVSYWALDDEVGSLAGEPSPTAGVFGQGLQFDGVDDRMGLSGVTYTNGFTLSYWFKLPSNSGTGYHYLYSHGTNSTQNSLNTYFIQDATSTASGVNNVLRTALIDADDGAALADLARLDIPAAGLADNQWHQYTLTTTAGGGSAVYIDGQLRASSATQGGDAIAPVGPVVLGARSDLAAGRFLAGALDDIALYHHTSSATTVFSRYSSTGPGVSGTLTITVTPVNTETPVITSDGGGVLGTPAVAENTTTVTTVTATDADVGGPALSYSIVGGADQALFSLDSASGVLSFRAAPDAENPTDTGRDNVYDVEVQASDGVHTDTQVLKVQVTDTNEHAVTPIVDGDSDPDEVDENAATGTTVGLTARATDADSSLNSITYTLTDTAGGRFAIDAASGVVTVAGLLDAEAATAHRITVRAVSSDGSFQVLDYMLTVRDLDEFDVGTPADADVAADNVLESAAVGTTVGITAVASDADLRNNSVTYSLTDDAGGRFAIGASSGVVTVARLLDAETALSHSITVQARSTDGSVASQSFSITVQDVDESPVGAIVDLDAAADEVREDAAIGTAVGFQAQATDADVSNNTVTYTLLDDAGGRFAIGAGSGVVTVARALDAETATSHTVQIRATSSDGSSSTRLVTLTVLDADEFDVSVPTDVDATADTVRDIDAVGTAVGITASASDADQSLPPITYTLADDAAGRFTIDATTGVVRLQRSVAADVGTAQTLVVQATSADGSTATRSFSVAITRANLFAPVLTSDGGGATAALSVAENATAVTTLVATDADVSPLPLTYALVGGADQARFALDANSGVLRFRAAPDAESPGDADANQVYDVVVQVSDGLRTDTQTLAVTVTDVNEFALGPLADTDAAADTVPENAEIGTPVGVRLQATDADATNNAVTYALLDNAGGRFAIDASTGVVTVAAALDAETAQQHTLVVRAVSADGSTSTRTLDIAVQDVNEFGTTPVTDADAQPERVREDDPVGTVVGLTAQAQDQDATDNAISYTLLDDAGGRFAIHATSGVLTIARGLDAETAQSHTVVVRALSSDGSAQTQAWTVTVADVDEFDVGPITDADPAPQVLAEDAAIGTPVGFTARAVDADVTRNAVTYALLDSAGGRFAIDASTGAVTVAGLLDAETAQQHTLVVQAVSADGSTSTRTLDIAVQDVNEFGVTPVTDADAQPERVREDDPVGTVVGLTAQAQDRDATGNAISYSLLDDAGGRFAIHATSGVLTIARGLDAETAQSHTVVVRALSSDGSAQTQAWTVTVADVDEFDVGPITDTDPAPEALAEDAALGTPVGFTARAVDADVTQNAVTYALLDSAGGRFAIDASTGVVTVAGLLDAETAQQHTLVVQAVSADGSTSTLTLDIAVQDVNEFGTTPVTDADAQPERVREDDPVGTVVGLTAQAQDQDATDNAISYTLLDDAGGRFAIHATSGVLTIARGLDAETAQSHTVVVRALSSDGSAQTRAWTVDVTDVDEFDVGSITDADPAPEALAEDAAIGTPVGVRLQATDADATNNAVTYALLDSAGGRFAIDASTGVVTVAAPLDAETAQQHTLVVQAISSDRSVMTLAFRVTVTDVDEFDLSPITDVDSALDTVAEDAAVGTPVGLRAWAVDGDVTMNTVTYALDDDAGGRFAIDARTGVITVAAALDAETASAHALVVRGTSADGSTWTQAFGVAVTDVDEFDLVLLADADVRPDVVLETAPVGTAVGVQGRAVDGDVTMNRVTYSLDDSAGGRFAVVADTGVVTLSAGVDEEGVALRTFVLRATSEDGSTVTRAFTVAITPVNDAVPVITSDGSGATAVRTVPEGSTTAVTQVRATDADLPAETLTYALAGGADAALFILDAQTGVLQWRTAPDHEMPGDADGDGVYEVVVGVGDGVHQTVQALSVVVDDVDEAPQWLANTLTVSEGGAASPVLLARDVDTPAARLVYTVQDLTGGRFEQVAAPGTGLLRFTQAEVDAGAIRFVADGGEAAPAYRLVLADDRSTLAAQPGAVAFTPVNDTPVVNPVDLGTLDEDTSRVFTAAELLAGATDAEGDPLTVSGLQLVAGAGTLTDLGDGRWRFDPAADWQGAVTLSGRVDDGQLGTALVASLQVQPVNDAPRIVSGDGVATLALAHAENAALVTTVVGADVESDTPLRYAVVGGADAARFQIDAATGVLSFRQAPDREQPADADADHRYDVTVQVSDGALTAQQALQITVTNVDEAPVVTRNVLLLTDGAVTLVLQARDPDTPAEALTYRVDAVEGGQFERAAQPGQAVPVFTQAELDAAQVAWVAPVGSTSARYALRLSDGVSEVLVGSPGVERQTVQRTLLEMAPVALLSGDRPSGTSESAESGVTTAAAADARRAAPPLAAPADNGGDASLGLGQGAETATGAGRPAGTKAAEVGAAVSRSAAARAGLAPVAERAEPALDLPSESGEAPRRLVTELDLWGSRSGTSLAEQLDRLRQEVADAQQAGMVSLASTALVSTGLSVGYVVWLVRGGVLMTSLMSVVPAWAGLDPLPVLSEIRRAEGGGVAADGTDEDEAGGGDDDPIEKLFSKARRLLVRPAAGSADAPGLPETPA